LKFRAPDDASECSLRISRFYVTLHVMNEASFGLQRLEDQPKKEKEQKKAAQEDIKGAEDLPRSVQALIAAFPARLRGQLLDIPYVRETTPESEEQALKEMLATFDHERRERFLELCLSELLQRMDVRHIIQERFGTSETDLKNGIIQFMETLWQNRGKKQEDMKLFGQEFYDEILHERGELEKEAEEKYRLLDVFRRRAPHYGRKRRHLSRQSESKEDALREALGQAVKKLDEFDERHNNTNYHQIYGRGIASRMRSERRWTHVVVRTAEYYEPAEFATSMAERLERGPFSAERGALRRRVGINRCPIRPERLKVAKKILETVSEAVDSWYASHEREGVLEKTVSSKKGDRQATLIKYFRELHGSYGREKKYGTSEDNLENTTRQMENTLRVLKNILEGE
jgi:hypothetical protein